MPYRQAILIILDGWGIGREDESNPIHMVKPKSFQWLEENFPITSLQASGISVGLPWGETGNSEVGHLTLGAGKVLYQHYPKIEMAIRDKSFFQNPVLKKAFAHARSNNAGINFAGLLSKANVHASLDHIKGLLKMAEMEGLQNVKLHLFADGKDSPPKSILQFLKEIPKEKLATLTGRYYAMDRSEHWDLTQAAYENMTGTGGNAVETVEAELENLFRRGLAEEYLPPLRLKPEKYIEDGDSLIFFNYREDSIRQLARSFILENFDKFQRKNFRNLFVAIFSKYEEGLDAPVVFETDAITDTLGKVLSDAGKTQLRVAESYKYAHVTYFFNGYREPPYKNEYRALIPSVSTPHPEEYPDLRASAITDRILEAVQSGGFDFVLANYSNPDTIGHTANYEAGLKAVKTIDRELDRLLKTAVSPETAIIITSDHGNVEEMLSPMTALPESQHDPNPVPLYLVAPEFKSKRFLNWRSLKTETMGSLAEVAPTILELMGVGKPGEMTGKSLLDGLE